MIHEKIIRFKGTVIITNKTTNERRIFKNVICNKFYDMIADFFVGTSPNKLSHLGIGTGTTPALPTDTTLQTEVSRVAITTTATSGSQIHMQTEIDGGTALFNWKELGIFNASSGGDMTNRVNIDYTHNAGDLVTVDWYLDKV